MTSSRFEDILPYYTTDESRFKEEFLVWPKIFRPAQNILRPVKGQGIQVQNVFCQTIYWIAFSAAPKHFGPTQKLNLLNSNHLLVCTKNVNHFLVQKIYQAHKFWDLLKEEALLVWNLRSMILLLNFTFISFTISVFVKKKNSKMRHLKKMWNQWKSIGPASVSRIRCLIFDCYKISICKQG